MMDIKLQRRTVLCWLSLLAVALQLGACDLVQLDDPDPNQAPDTDLALNEPMTGDTLFALVTLHWDGGDHDGFVDHYEWRYATKHYTGSTATTECRVPVGTEVTPDSVLKVDSTIVLEGWEEVSATDWTSTPQTSRTLPFDSEAEYNLQVFEVRAVDDVGEHDPSPAQRCFFTRKTVFPEVEIVNPAGDGHRFFVLDATTDWWHGLSIDITGVDEDGEIEAFGWAIDEGDWHWTQDTSLVLTPDLFTPLEGEHVIRVTARDNTNLTAPVGDSVIVNLMRPSFERDILVIDGTNEEQLPSGLKVTDADVDGFYAELFGTEYTWDYAADGMPPKDVLGRYRLVVWHMDNAYASSTNPHPLPRHTAELTDYLNAGGDFVMSGWRVLKSFELVAEDGEDAFGPGTFVHDYLHIHAFEETSRFGEFTGAFGVDEFSDVAVDPDKLTGRFPPTMGNVNLITQRGGFTEIIYTYSGKEPENIKQAVGVQYVGTSFDAVVLGFPIFFLDDDDAQTLAREVLQGMGYEAP